MATFLITISANQVNEPVNAIYRAALSDPYAMDQLLLRAADVLLDWPSGMQLVERRFHEPQVVGPTRHRSIGAWQQRFVNWSTPAFQFFWDELWKQRVKTCPWLSDRSVSSLRTSKPYLSIHAAAKEYCVTSFWLRDWIARGGLSLHEWQEGKKSRLLLAREKLDSLFRKLRDENTIVMSTVGDPLTANPQMVSAVKGWLSVAQAARILAVNWRMANSLIDAGVVKADRTSGVTSVDPSSLHNLVEKIDHMAGEYSPGNMSLWNNGQVICLITRAEQKIKLASRIQAVAIGKIKCIRYRNRPGLAGIAIYRSDLETLEETVHPKGAALTTVEVCFELRCRAPDVRELVATGFLKEIEAATTNRQTHPKGRHQLRVSLASVQEFQSTWVLGSSMSEGPPSHYIYKDLIHRFGEPAYLGKWVKVWSREAIEQGRQGTLASNVGRMPGESGKLRLDMQPSRAVETRVSRQSVRGGENLT